MTSEHFRYALALQYAGGEFSGWQRQPNVPTVQGALEQAAAKLTDEPITLQVAGRTDAGVHATGQIASFSSSLKPEARNWQRGLKCANASLYLCQLGTLGTSRISSALRRNVASLHIHFL